MRDIFKDFEAFYEEEIFQQSLENCNATEQKVFNKSIYLLRTEPINDGSIIYYHQNDSEEKSIKTNKAVSYWCGMDGEELFLRGELLTIDGKRKLIVSFAIPCKNAQGLEKYSTEQLISFERKMKNYSQKKKKTIYSQLAKLDKYPQKENRKNNNLQMASVEELESLFEIVGELLPEDVRAEVQRCFTNIKTLRRENSERETCRKVVCYLLSYPWWSTDDVYDIETIKKHLNTTHIGQEYAKKVLLKEAYGVKQSEDKTPCILLIVGPPGSGKTTLATSFLQGMGKSYGIINVSGISDEIVLAGSGKEYENGKPGAIFLTVQNVGNGGGLILDNIDQVDAKCINALNSLLDKKFVDHFLMVPVDMTKTWILLLANDIKDVNQSFLAKVDEVICLEQYKVEEKEEIINKVLVPRHSEKYNMQQTEDFSKEVCEEIIRFSAGQSIGRIEKIVQAIFLSAVERRESFPHITKQNFQEYYSLGNIEDIKKEYATSHAEYERKTMACYPWFPRSIQERNVELMNLLTHGTKEEREYANKALRITSNILKDEVTRADVSDIYRELNQTHYGLDSVKNAVCRDILSHSLTKTSKVKAIVLSGCAGVGKTSIARSVAKAMKRPFVKISLNGVSTAERLKGSPKTYRDAQAGLIASNVGKEGICSYSTVVLLDEVDKMIVRDEQNNPNFALYDILDSDNGGYYEEFLECIFPTEDILFILTCNDITKLSPIILDRCEVIEVGGYSRKQKKAIIQSYVIPKIAERYRLDEICMSDEVLNILLDDYCISTGVRDAERAVAKVIEQKALNSGQMLNHDILEIAESDLRQGLGGKQFGHNDFPEQSKECCGQARALAVAGNCGVTFAIQITDNMYGEEETKITGLVKGSFEESIAVAKTLVCNKLKCTLPKIHIHATDAGTPKDGPSAGLTLFVSMMSFMKKIAIPNVAFTGAIDLFGNVRVMGGLYLKLCSAERAGVEKVYIPKENYIQLCDSKEIDAFDMQIVPISHVDEIMEALFGEEMKTCIQQQHK